MELLLGGGMGLLEILKHFMMFYFLLNVIILILAFRYDYSREYVREKGWTVLIKPVLRLLFGGITFMFIQVIDEL